MIEGWEIDGRIPPRVVLSSIGAAVQLQSAEGGMASYEIQSSFDRTRAVELKMSQVGKGQR